MASNRELVVLYNINNENQSWESGENAARLGGTTASLGQNNSTASLPQGNATVWNPQLTNLALSGLFPSAPSFYSMNGYVYANNPIFEMCYGDSVIWYVMAYGAASKSSACFKPSFFEHALTFRQGMTYHWVVEMEANLESQFYSHVFHMHGNGFSYLGQQLYAISLNDGVGLALSMTAAGEAETTSNDMPLLYSNHLRRRRALASPLPCHQPPV